MKITTWNVNGLRAALQKDSWSWTLAHDPDVLCLQEIKARPDQLSLAQHQLFSQPYAHWNPAARPGYSGVATFTRSQPAAVELGLGIEMFDLEGRVIRTRHADFLLYNIYFPSGQRDYGRVQFKLDFYARLLETCDQLHATGEALILCGDFNTAHREIDLRNPRQNVRTSGFLPEERLWIDHYLSHGFVDAYRALYPQRVQYTWWTNITSARQRDVGWRLDYFLVSEALMDRVRDVIIHTEVLGSDHCPVTLLID